MISAKVSHFRYIKDFYRNLLPYFNPFCLTLHTYYNIYRTI